MIRPLRIGTRGSPLALAQAHMVAEALRASAGVETEIVPITTSGDMIQDRPLAEVGGKALWTKELDRCLIEGRTDLSVHSMKDVETIRPDALVVAAMLERADTRDRLVGADSLDALPEGARVGTSSPRRTAQLLARRPDLEIASIRGNVQTRLAKIERGEFDATLLAAAGLDRLGLEIGVPLDGFLPAPAQGAIGIEVLADNAEVRGLVAAIDHGETHRCVALERAFLAALGGDCRSAVAAQAGDGRLSAEILSPDGREVLAEDGSDPAELAQRLLARASPALRAMFAG
ncbi:hydroxymethylbilane synthase [Sphingosinicella sp. LHD-64]|uniref:hydroxymethylbilane synthase n=1 Tax=Sphingosinicella sp. LHD-64 TaxID=3072139 RepID=UPI00280FE893|nr:hydroxymethylbilane synthase [Sphingosinicella sp. LHD-64]MDQ8757060.1 hydroxymethylbilane synthase [Sphingosinicella sp. LHD-64]